MQQNATAFVGLVTRDEFVASRKWQPPNPSSDDIEVNVWDGSLLTPQDVEQKIFTIDGTALMSLAESYNLKNAGSRFLDRYFVSVVKNETDVPPIGETSVGQPVSFVVSYFDLEDQSLLRTTQRTWWRGSLGGGTLAVSGQDEGAEGTDARATSRTEPLEACKVAFFEGIGRNNLTRFREVFHFNAVVTVFDDRDGSYLAFRDPDTTWFWDRYVHFEFGGSTVCKGPTHGSPEEVPWLCPNCAFGEAFVDTRINGGTGTRRDYLTCFIVGAAEQDGVPKINTMHCIFLQRILEKELATAEAEALSLV